MTSRTEVKVAMSVGAAARPAFEDVPDARRRNMRAVQGRDTAAERRVRRRLHALGYRFRLHARDLPGRPDIVFSARRRVIEVRGCFWHRHPDPTCRNAVLPATRRDWWVQKLEANVARDARNLAALQAAGWEVLVLWECALADPGALDRQLTEFLGPTRFRPGRSRTAFRAPGPQA